MRNQLIGQSFGVGVEVIVRNFDSLAAREIFDRGQLVSSRHFRAVDQDWDDRHIALKRTLNFEPYKIIFVGAGDPVFSNDSDKRIAGADLFGKNLEPIEAKVDIVDIKKDVLAPDLLSNAVVNRARSERGFLPTIADEDAAQYLKSPPT
jgi:hypothetical protein